MVEKLLNDESFDRTEDENLKILEEKSWEELRMKHREIETQVNEEELINMKEYDVNKKKTEVEIKLNDLETINDAKVLEKQNKWFEEEVKYQEMKRKLTEERMREEHKRKPFHLFMSWLFDAGLLGG